MKRLPLAALAFVLAGTPVLSQSVDPQEVLNQLIRQKQIEMQQEFQDRQQQRQVDLQERAHDREFCTATNAARPNVERCIRDLAEWRRSGWRPPEQPSQPIDYSAFGTPAPNSPQQVPGQTPSSRADVPLTSSGGIFAVPVVINGAITLDFAVDSGASDVSIPLDVFSTLKRTGTIKDSDILGQKTYVLADGSKSQSITFTNSIPKGLAIEFLS